MVHRARTSKFLVNVLRVGGGGAVGQFLVIAASPLLTRLFEPTDFGVYAIYTSVVIVAGTVACLRFDVAIPVPRLDSTAVALGRLATGTLLTIAVLSAIFVAVAVAGRLGGLKLSLTPGAAAGLIFLGVVGYGGYQLLNYWAIRRHLYKSLAQTRVTRGVMQVVFQVATGLIGTGAVGLMLGHALGHLSGLVAIGRDFFRHLVRRPLKWSRLLWTARRYRRFAVFSTPAALISSATLQLPPVLLALLYDPVAAGYFAIAQRVVATPAGIIGLAISQVFMSETMVLVRSSRRKMRVLYLRALASTFIIGLVPIGLIAVGGPWLFGLVFGDQWSEAGNFVRAMSIMFITQFAVYPVSQTLHAIERTDLQLLYDIVRMVLGVGTLVGLGLLHVAPVAALLGYSIALAAAYLFYMWLGYRALGNGLT